MAEKIILNFIKTEFFTKKTLVDEKVFCKRRLDNLNKNTHLSNGHVKLIPKFADVMNVT